MNQRTKMKKVRLAKKRRTPWWEQKRDWEQPKDGWALEGSWDTTEDRKLWEAQRRIGGPTSELKPKVKNVEEVLKEILDKAIHEAELRTRETPPQ